MGRSNSLLYGLLALPLSFAALPVYVHVPHFYAATTDLSLATLGAILLITRLFDAGVDPWLGWVADRVPLKLMLIAALFPFALGFFALLNPPTENVLPWL